MIVIQQPSVKGALPQPLGPSSSSPKAQRIAEYAGSSSASAMLTVKAEQETFPTAIGTRKRTMGRSTSMFQTNLRPGDNVSHSRSTSPLTSISSSAESNSIAAMTPLTSAATSVSLSSRTSVSRRKEKGAELRQPSALHSNAAYGAVKASSSSTSFQDDPAALSYDVPVDIAMPAFSRPSSNVQRDLARVWEAVAGARRIAVICGAGISVSSPANIPDFRSAGGLFRKLKEKHPNVGLQSGKDLFDANLFNSSTTSACFYSMISELKAMADAASPTSFHHLLKRLDMEGRLMRVYTQNIDGLEEKAGLSFGLGEAGDSRSTLRALGKRKREAAQRKVSGGLTRSKSEPSILLGHRDEAHLNEPMFPRAIPLHGSLSTMTCQVCGHKVYLTLASPGPQRLPSQVRELSPDASDQAVNALDLLSQGEAVRCKRCEQGEEVREVAGLRSRGVGMMKVDVVLYNGQNDGAERVGDCVERDILGLRDPNETAVPESHRERLLRERKERKDEAKRAATEKQGQLQGAITVASCADDAFAAAFGEDEEDAQLAEEEIGFGSQTSLPGMQGKGKKPKRQARLKPLPPDLLIVAGTSLKVPGTKRIVREFAKACQARDYREYESSDDEESETSDRSRGSSPRTTRSSTKKEEENEEHNEEEEDDIHAPIRTILLNYDFPLPHTQWEDVFDVWVQGDVQQAALGLWDSTTYPADQALNDFHMGSDEHHDLPRPDLSWSSLQTVLEEERKAAKKAAAAALKREKASSQTTDCLPASQKTKASSEKTALQRSVSGKANAKKTEKPAKSQTKSEASKKGNASAKNAAPSPVKKKAKKAVEATKSSLPPPANAGLNKYMKGSTKASIARTQSAPAAAASTKAKKSV